MTRGALRPLAVTVAVLVAIALGSGCAAHYQPSLVDRVIEAYGGAKPASAPALEQVGRIVSPMHPGAVGTVVRRSAGPSRLRVETTFPGQGTEVRVVDGDRGWRDGVEVTGPNLAAMQLQAARLSVASLLEQRRARLTDGGEIASGGARRHVLVVDLGQGRTLTLEVEPETGHVLRTVGRAEATAGGPAIEFATDYGELRSIEGGLVPFYECTTAMGRRTADITFASATVVPAFPAGTFAP